MTGNHVQVIHCCQESSKPVDICKDPSLPSDRILVILGASARAAAHSAQRAGFHPAAADLFGDRDLVKAAKWVPIQDYPHGLLEAAAKLPGGPWLYTGGLENHPELVDRLAATRPLLGNPGSVLRAVRDPFQLADCLHRHGFDTPQILREPPLEVPAERWLRKPLRSCGGHGIEMLQNTPADAMPMQAAAEYIYQQFVPGVGFSAVFLAAGGAAVLIGATRQMVGESWTGAHRFAYCGSLWPAQLDSNTLATLSRLGECLAADFCLTGLFGVDFVLCGSQVFVVEVNPRYVASIEVLERTSATAHSVIQQHVDACREGVLPAAIVTEAGTSCGKAILFASNPIRIGERFEQLVVSMNHDRPWPPLADIPVEGTVIQAGQPILTLRAEAPTPQAVHDRLRQLAQQIRAALDAC